MSTEKIAIEQIVVRHVRMQLRAPFVTAQGVEHTRDIIVVEVHSEGLVGYGEAPVLSAPTYNEETVETAWHVLNDFFVPRALAASHKGCTPQEVAGKLGVFKGHAFAKAGLEGAMWDAAAKRAGVALSELLHRCSAGDDRRAIARGRVAAGVVVGLPRGSDEGELSLLRHVEARLQEGYRRIKLKIEPGRDSGPLRALRRTFGDISLSVDANGTYRPADRDVLQRLDSFALAYIEQPLAPDDMSEHASLQRALKTSVCLDESIASARQARQALEWGSCRVMNVKASRIGGLTEALTLHDLGHAAGVPLLCGGLLESGIGRAHNVALASLPGFTLPADLSASDRYWERDIVRPAFKLDSDGYIAVPGGPGIGVEVDDAFLQELTVRARLHRTEHM